MYLTELTTWSSVTISANMNPKFTQAMIQTCYSSIQTRLTIRNDNPCADLPLLAWFHEVAPFHKLPSSKETTFVTILHVCYCLLSIFSLINNIS